ncbi:MAG: type I methionyl aminopeptidase [Thermoleophilia bacterium]|nr:type I methionyl aminopeptidase [Thermoleophilia bacterium]
MRAKTPGELDAIAASGAVLRECLDLLASEARVGVTTAELDGLAEEFIRSHGGTGAFKGYHGYPATITTSINEQVVHGIPGDYVLREGDVASIDCGVVLDGWVSDSARTVSIGEIDDEAGRLLEITRQSLDAGIAACVAGNTVGDVGHAVESVVAGAGYAVVRALVGHGVGRAMHEEPQVPNYGVPGSGPTLIDGLVIAIEPMVTVGSHEVVTASDGWTVSTQDGSLSAHFEHTVAATTAGPRILTA